MPRHPQPAIRPNRPYSVGIALSAALAQPNRFRLPIASDDIPSLATIVPLGLLTLLMMWAVISPF